jgi:hypothetical protein
MKIPSVVKTLPSSPADWVLSDFGFIRMRLPISQLCNYSVSEDTTRHYYTVLLDFNDFYIHLRFQDDYFFWSSLGQDTGSIKEFNSYDSVKSFALTTGNDFSFLMSDDEVKCFLYYLEMKRLKFDDSGSIIFAETPNLKCYMFNTNGPRYKLRNQKIYSRSILTEFYDNKNKYHYSMYIHFPNKEDISLAMNILGSISFNKDLPDNIVTSIKRNMKGININEF